MKIPPSPLLDRWVPNAQFVDTISIRFPGPPEDIMRAARAVTPQEMRLAVLVGWLRYLPGRLTGRRPPAVVARRPFFDELVAGGNIILEEDPTEVIIGMAGKLHQVRDQEPVRFADTAAFERFAEPGHEKLAMSLRVVGDRLVLEHRTLALDEDARRRFARYWVAIKPGGAFVTRQLLQAIRRRAQLLRAPGDQSRQQRNPIS